MAALWRHPGRTRALNRMDILQNVIRHKSRFFASAWASYDTAKPGSFHLAPPEHRFAALAKDLDAMGPMFLSTQPAFKELLQQLAEAEEILNSSRG